MTAFSNGTEFEIWSANWCNQCKKDELGGAPEGTYCDILSDVMMLNETPPQWSASETRDYHCSEFSPG